MIVIYILKHPNTNEIRYIGKTKQKPETRLQGHVRDAFRHTTKNGNWIKSLLKNDLYPAVEILDTCEEDDWIITEQYWISQFKTWGFNLNNLTDGGDGNQNQVFSKESQLKKSETLKRIYREGKFGNEYTRRKQSEARMGYVPSAETREKLRQYNLGKIATEESKAKKRKIVLVYDGEDLIEEFESVLAASEKYNCRKSTISNACLGRRKTLYGLVFKYK